MFVFAAGGLAPASAAGPLVSISCQGNVVTGTVQLPGASQPVLGISLYVDLAGGLPTFVPTTETQKVTVPAGGVKHFSMDTSGFNADRYLVKAVLSDGTAMSSNAVPDSLCAPAPVVSEASTALTLPVSLLATGAVMYLVVSRRRRRFAAPA